MKQQERFNSKNRATWVVVECIDNEVEHIAWDRRALQLWQRAIRNKAENPRSQVIAELAVMLEEEYRSSLSVDDLDGRYEELLECALIDVDWVGIASRLVIDAMLCRAPWPTGPATPPALQRVQVPIGVLSVSPQLDSTLSYDQVLQELDRHLIGDWGDCSSVDWQANNVSLINEGRIVSHYHDRSGIAFCLATEADRSRTTAMLLEEC